MGFSDLVNLTVWLGFMVLAFYFFLSGSVEFSLVSVVIGFFLLFLLSVLNALTEDDVKEKYDVSTEEKYNLAVQKIEDKFNARIKAIEDETREAKAKSLAKMQAEIDKKRIEKYGSEYGRLLESRREKK